MSGLQWFRVDNDVVDHPKVHALAALLQDPNAGWYLVRLWAWTMRYAARGQFADGSRTALETSCGWRGQSGALVAALIEVGLLDEIEENGQAALEVHDWWESQGKVVEKAKKDAARQKAARERRGTVRGQSRDRPRDEARTPARTNALAARVRDETRRDETLKEDAVGERPPLNLQPAEPLKPKKPRPSDELCADFLAIVGSKYGWNGAKDGENFAWLLKQAPLEQIRDRWRRGLAHDDKFKQVRTVAQLRSKWNDLAPPASERPVTTTTCAAPDCNRAAPTGWPDIGVPCCHTHANEAAEWCNKQGLEPWVHARQWLERGFRRAS